MTKPKSEAARIVYWSKEKKKNVHKTVSISKFGGDKEKAMQFLMEWKEKELQKEQKPTDEKIETVINENKPPEPEVIENVVVPDIIQEDIKLMPTIPFTEFKLQIPDLKKDACSTVIYGSSKAGKTTQAMDIINEYYGESFVITLVFSPNIHSAVYNPLKNDKYIKFDRWDDQIIRDIHRIQKKTKNRYCFLIVIDDCILEKLSPQILQLLLVLRNSRINTLLNLQSVTLLSRNGRNNGNNFIFKNFNNDEVITDAMKYFLGSFEPFYGLEMEQKIRLYKEAVRNYGFIYLNALDGIVTFHRSEI